MLKKPSLVVCFGALLVSVAPVSQAQPANQVGIYHWGGSLHIPMDQGVNMIADMGSHVARVVFSSRYYSDYGNSSTCYSGFSLSGLMREPAVQRALDDARIQTLVITAFDGASFSDCQTLSYLNPRFYTDTNTAAVEAEYRDFVLYLFQRYNGSGRRFIISNWESDNAIYCDSAFSYATDGVFRQQCDSNYAASYDGNTGILDSFAGIRLWLAARQEGIAEGLALAQEAGLGGMEVVHAPEINIVRTLASYGFPDVVSAVLPGMRLDAVSYSAYESINSSTPDQTIAQDIGTIRADTGAPHIIIGEAGIPRSEPNSAVSLRSVIEAALSAGVEDVVVWNLNDQDGVDDFGAFDQAGAITSTGRMLETLLHSIQNPGRTEAFSLTQRPRAGR